MSPIARKEERAELPALRRSGSLPAGAGDGAGVPHVSLLCLSTHRERADWHALHPPGVPHPRSAAAGATAAAVHTEPPRLFRHVRHRWRSGITRRPQSWRSLGVPPCAPTSRSPESSLAASRSSARLIDGHRPCYPRPMTSVEETCPAPWEHSGTDSHLLCKASAHPFRGAGLLNSAVARYRPVPRRRSLRSHSLPARLSHWPAGARWMRTSLSTTLC